METGKKPPSLSFSQEEKKKRCRYKFLSIVVVLIIPQFLGAESFKVLSDEKFVHFLNDFQIIAEKNVVPEYTVRIFKLIKSGECNSNSENCAKVELFIAVSDFGEDPKQNVYLLNKAYDWTLEKWTKIPEYISPKKFIEFELTKKNNKSKSFD